MPAETVAFLTSEEGKDDLAAILTLHVVAGKALASDVTDGLSLETLNGQSLMFAVNDSGVFVNGATIVATNVLATNGVIHVIDTVLLPQITEEAMPISAEVERIEGSFVALNLQDAIDYLYTNGLTMFATEDTFMGASSLRRDEAAAFFARFARDVLGMEVDTEAQGCDFSDLAEAHQDLLGEVTAACQLGLFKGSEGKFMPRASFTNEQALAVLVRLIDGDKEEVAGNWAANYYAFAKEAGLTVSLHADMQEHLSLAISRADVAKLIEAAAYMKIDGVDGESKASMEGTEEDGTSDEATEEVVEEETVVETGSVQQ